jgi:hypothetical protein
MENTDRFRPGASILTRLAAKATGITPFQARSASNGVVRKAAPVMECFLKSMLLRFRRAWLILRR